MEGRMTNLARSTPLQEVNRYFFEAIVVQQDVGENKALLKFDHSRNFEQAWAQIALATGTIENGARVLTVGDACNGFYVISLLEKEQSKEKDAVLSFQNGTYARIKKQDSNEKLCVYNADNTMELSYDPYDKRLTISNNSGDVKFVSSGNIVFKSDQGVELQGEQITLMSQSLKNEGKIDSSRLSINQKRLTISSKQLDMTSLASNIVFKRVKFNANEAIATARKVKLIVGRFERRAESIVEKAKNIFQTIEGLAQLKVKRMKTNVKETYHMKSKRAFIKSEQDYKIKSDKIHLG
jgi:hypothetical protein